VSDEHFKLMNFLIALAALCLTCFGVGLAIGALL